MSENISFHIVKLIVGIYALDGVTVSSSSINAFKSTLTKIRMTRMGYFMD